MRYKSLGFGKGVSTLAEQYADEALSLPIYNGIRREEVEHVIASCNGYKIQ